MHKIGILSDTHGLLRPEVAEALREGEGRSVRQSSTMQRSTFY